jgi:thymidylate synthase
MKIFCATSWPMARTNQTVAVELLWFLRGDSNVKWMQDQGVTIWNEWADAEGELGPVYGVQWRSWPTPDGGHIDQIAELVESLKKNPDSRRHIVSAWNVGELKDMALPPCHAFFQRSADMFLGVPFNIASYSLLTCMLAQQTGLEPGEFVWTGGDVHIYDNHMDQVLKQLDREPYDYPQLKITRKPESIFDYTLDDFEVVGYKHHPTIKAPIAV